MLFKIKRMSAQNKAFQKSQWNGKDQFAQTPTEVMVKLVEEFGLLNDVCPADPQRNGLEESWQRVNYMNPPYAEMDKWLEKAISEWKQEKTVVALIPARTNCNWFHNYCIVMRARYVSFDKESSLKGTRKGLFCYLSRKIANMQRAKSIQGASVNFYEKRKAEEISENKD